MTKYKLEYIWLDGYKLVPNLRGKTQLKDFDAFPTLEQLPLWGFDGSSTMQAEGHSSDCVLNTAMMSSSDKSAPILSFIRAADNARSHSMASSSCAKS